MDGEREGKDHCFNPNKLLLDPYAKTIEGSFRTGNLAVYACQYEKLTSEWIPNNDSNFGVMPKCRVTHSRETYIEGWEQDTFPKIPLKDSIIYKLHGRALTQDPSSRVGEKGTYLEPIEKIPYFRELGITTVELLPIHLFNPQESCKT